MGEERNKIEHTFDIFFPINSKAKIERSSMKFMPTSIQTILAAQATSAKIGRDGQFNSASFTLAQMLTLFDG